MAIDFKDYKCNLRIIMFKNKSIIQQWKNLGKNPHKAESFQQRINL